MSKIGKSRNAGTSGHGSASKWRNSALSESSDDEFDRCKCLGFLKKIFLLMYNA